MIVALIKEGRLLHDQIQKHYDLGHEALPPEERITEAELQAWYDGVTRTLEQQFGAGSVEASIWKDGLERISKESSEQVGKAHTRGSGYFVKRHMAESLGLLGQIRLLHLKDAGEHMGEGHPAVFVSYSWDDEAHKLWVKDLATRLRADGVDVTLDQWEVVPGDQLPAYMERGVRESRFVIIICTPRYKEKSDLRTGGVGYEGSIITAEVAASNNQRKFIPVLARGEWIESAPTWVMGKAYVDLRGDALAEPRYEDLLVTLHETREGAPPLGPVPSFPKSPSSSERSAGVEATATAQHPSAASERIKILEIVAEEVGKPRNDGTRGSALYAVPFRLSTVPSPIWAKAFLQTWDRPPRFTSMHRPGIARVRGDRVILDGTTIEEVEKYHKDTLLLAVETANEIEAQIAEERKRTAAEQTTAANDHERSVRESAKRIKF